MMAGVRNLLTGRAGQPRSHGAVSTREEAKPEGHHEDMKALLETLNAELTRLAGELSAAHVTMRAQHIEAETARAALQGRLEQALATQGRVEQDLATERALREGLVAQLSTEREARAALKAPLEQAIAAAAKPPLVVQAPAAEPPDWQFDVTGHDANGRMRTIRAHPVMAKKES